jgi:hypothetical protein
MADGTSEQGDAKRIQSGDSWTSAGGLERVPPLPLFKTASRLDLPHAPLTVERPLPVFPPENKDDHCHERENDRNRREVQGHVAIPSR